MMMVDELEAAAASRPPLRANWVPRHAQCLLCLEIEREQDAPAAGSTEHVRLGAWKDGTVVANAAVLRETGVARFVVPCDDEAPEPQVVVVALTSESAVCTVAQQESRVTVTVSDEVLFRKAPQADGARALHDTAFSNSFSTVSSAVGASAAAAAAGRPRGPPGRTLAFHVDAAHGLCDVRRTFCETIEVGSWRVQLRMRWRVTRRGAQEVGPRLRPREPATRREEAQRAALQEAFARAVGADTPQDGAAGSLVLRNYMDKLQAPGAERGAQDAMEHLSELGPAVVAQMTPALMEMLCASLPPEHGAMIEALQTRPAVFGMLTLLLSMPCDDALFDDADTHTSAIVELAATVPEAVLHCFVQLLLTILVRTLGRDHREEIGRALEWDSGRADQLARRLMNRATTGQHLVPVVSALCTVLLTGTWLAHEVQPDALQVNWRHCVETVLTSVARCQSLELAWSGVTRLYPACLSITDPSVIARDVKALAARSARAAARLGARRVMSGDVLEEVGLLLDAVAHVFFLSEEASAWDREVLPSTEHWVQLNLVPEAAQLLLAALECSRAAGKASDGFDGLLEGLLNLVERMPHMRAPHKLDRGLMTLPWVLRQLWPVVRGLMRLTSSRGRPVCAYTVSLLHLLATGQDGPARAGSHSVLQDILYRADAAERHECVALAMRTLVVHLRDPDTRGGAPEQGAMAMEVVSQTLELELESAPALLASDNALREAWMAILELLLAAGCAWERADHASWALKTVRQLIARFATAARKRGGSGGGGGGEDSRPGASLPSPPLPLPWFALQVSEGLVGLWRRGELDGAVALVGVECLNVLLEDDASRPCVEAVAGLHVFHSAHSEGSHAELDRWLVHLEDRCVKREFCDRLFALRALASALCAEPEAAPLYFGVVECLLGQERTRVASPWLAPSPCLVEACPMSFSASRRPGSAVAAVSVRSRGQKGCPMARSLALALELQREGLRRARGGSWRARLFPRLVNLQIQVQLALCGALDDVGKDILARDLEDTLGALLALDGGSDSPTSEERELRVRFGVLFTALVDDALRESLRSCWRKLSESEGVDALLARVHAGPSAPGVPVTHVLAYDAACSRWSAGAAGSLLCLEDWMAKAERVGVFFGPEGGRQETTCVGPADALDLSKQSRKLFVLPAYSFDKGLVAYARLDDKVALRVEAATAAKEKADKLNVSGRAALGALREEAPVAALLPESVRRVHVVKLSAAKACKERLALSITHLRSWLEHEVWLARYDGDADAAQMRATLYTLVGNEILNCASPGAAGGGAVGYQTARAQHEGDAELQQLCDSLMRVVEVALESMRAAVEQAPATAALVARIEEQLGLQG